MFGGSSSSNWISGPIWTLPEGWQHYWYAREPPMKNLEVFKEVYSCKFPFPPRQGTTWKQPRLSGYFLSCSNHLDTQSLQTTTTYHATPRLCHHGWTSLFVSQFRYEQTRCQQKGRHSKHFHSNPSLKQARLRGSNEPRLHLGYSKELTWWSSG